jgi:hypothetical protein
MPRRRLPIGRQARNFVPQKLIRRVDRRGIEPRFPGCEPDVVPLDQRPVVVWTNGFHKRPRWESNPQNRGNLTPARFSRFAYPAADRPRRPITARVAGPGVAPGDGAYETPLGTGPPATVCFSFGEMTKGRFELPRPKARRSERRVSAVSPLGLCCSRELTRAGIEPAFAA